MFPNTLGRKPLRDMSRNRLPFCHFPPFALRIKLSGSAKIDLEPQDHDHDHDQDHDEESSESYNYNDTLPVALSITAVVRLGREQM